jgi:diaminopimelate decarboxylase
MNLFKIPSLEFFEYINECNTPSIVYYMEGIQHTVNLLRSDLSLLSNARVHLAVKTTYSEHLLRYYVNKLDGCDVASVGEYQLIKDLGYKRITSTSPYYSKEEMKYFIQNNVKLDLDSLDQLYQFRATCIELGLTKQEVGIRLKIPFTDAANTDASFGNDSRFGIDFNRYRQQLIKLNYDPYIKIVSIHMHTGQNTTINFKEKIIYTMEVIEQLEYIEEINLGGGLLYLYIDRNKMLEILNEMNIYINDWMKTHHREFEFIFEPGAALLAGNGYLATKVGSIQSEGEFELANVDVSFWNLNPWVAPSPVSFSSEGLKTYFFGGKSMYENDKIGPFQLPPISKNETIIFSNFGAYTSNKKNFNLLGNIGESFYE